MILSLSSSSSKNDFKSSTRTNMIVRSLFCILIVLGFSNALAATTDQLSNAEIEGRKLVQQILELSPTQNVTNTGVLKIRDGKGKRTEIPLRCEVVVTPIYWLSIYEATSTNQSRKLIVRHTPGQAGEYFYQTNKATEVPLLGDVPIGQITRSDRLSSAEIMTPFAGSDFWLADLGLEFFHWPQQKILRKEFRRSCGCMVLESVNPNPSPKSYSRVVTWIDEESFGVVQAEAYDSKNKLLKEFYPKDIKKVNGQWQVQTLDISNDQTDSSTRMEFDSDAK